MAPDKAPYRVAAGVEYDGAGFAGWQMQAHARSVQGAVEAALARVANHPIRVVCAGRTDSGVHAEGQVIHFDTTASRREHSWLLGANSNLRSDVVLRWVRAVPRDFHARFAARRRHYRYTILNRATRPAVGRERVAYVRRSLDAQAMSEAALNLTGEHDFSAFRAAGCQARSPIRRILLLNVAREGEIIEIDIVANAFLHHMVRNIAGTLIAVGTGDRPPCWTREVLASRDRTTAGVTAPAGGLRFLGVDYPGRFNLPLLPASEKAFAIVNTSASTD